MSSTALVAVGILGLILVSFTGQCYGELEVGFYKRKCIAADVEKTVADVVKAMFFKDPMIAAALLRTQFHDCFVNECDASILLDGSSSEKTVPNFSIGAFDLIDAAKAAVETVCPGVVSCSDIIVMATRQAVYLSGGGRYNVQTGRRDGFVSLASNVDLPAPSISVTQSVAAFAREGFDATDMVYLLGGHTIGVAHCFLFQDRHYNCQNTSKPDPSMDSLLLKKLRLICPPNSAGRNTAKLDQNDQNDQNRLSSFIVDNSFYSVTAANSWPSTRKQYKIHRYLLEDHLMVTEQ